VKNQIENSFPTAKKEEHQGTKKKTQIFGAVRLGLKPQWLPTPGELRPGGGLNHRLAPCLS
jgi:hypothetical protein